MRLSVGHSNEKNNNKINEFSFKISFPLLERTYYTYVVVDVCIYIFNGLNYLLNVWLRLSRIQGENLMTTENVH